MASKGRMLPSSSLTLLPVSILCFVREPHTRHQDSWISIIHLRGPFFQGFHCTFHFLIHFHLHNVDFTKSWRIIAEYFLKLTMNQLQSLLHDSLIATGHIQHCAIIRRKDTSLRASTVGFSVSVSLKYLCQRNLYEQLAQLTCKFFQYEAEWYCFT